MQLADRSPTAPLAGDRAPHVFSGQNRKAYLRLKLSLSLGLRRQIFLAVCDDLALRNRIAARLYAELSYPSPRFLATEATASSSRQSSSASVVSPLDHRLSVVADAHDSMSTPPTALPSRLYPRLVSLNLNLSDPNPMVQIAEWLAEYPPPKGSQLRSPSFQILGVERLTRQPALVQKRFLHSLQQIEHYLSRLESPLLLWLPRPWLNAVQQSAPNFWNWRTALFEFEGDPTPVRSVAVRLDTQALNPATRQKDLAVDQSQRSIAVCNVPPQNPYSPLPTENPAEAAIVPTETTSDKAAPGMPNASQENLWDILSHDLAQLNGTPQKGSSQKLSRQEASSQKLSPAAALAAAPIHALTALPTSDATASLTTIALPHLHPDDQADETVIPLPANLAMADASVAEPVMAKLAVDLSVPVTEVPVTEVPVAETVAEATEPLRTPVHATNSATEQSQAALALADLILAVVADETNETPSSQSASMIQALQQIEQLHLQQAPQATLLAAYQNLGSLCRGRIEQGNASSQHLLLTVCVYEQTLQWLDDASLLWSDVLNDIGNLYWLLSRQESAVDDSLTYLDQAIAAYQQAIAKTNPDTRPHNYAMIQNNIGSAYGDMARFRTPAESLQESVAAYELALRYRPLHDDPARYAATQNNLGTAYWNLAQHQQPARRLKQAIASYFEALRYYSPDCEPIHYAMIQNNLGTAYWNLAQQPQSNLGVGTVKGKTLSAADLLQRAIAAYRAALVYRTLDAAPSAYAATQNNLGTAYWQLASLIDSQPDQHYELLQQAIVAYKAAITAVEYLTAGSANAPALSFDPAATHNNLGLAYYQLATDQQKRDSRAQRSAHLEAALRHHLYALQAWQSQSELYETVFSYVIQTMRAFHNEFGSKGQTLALSQVPANLLPEVLKQL